MATLIYALNQSLDGFVDHMVFVPDAVLFQHFTDQLRDSAGSLYGRRMYEAMRYWDDDQANWDEAKRDYAAAWRAMPKWVVSRTLKSVGPNAELVGEDLASEIRALKDRVEGWVEVAGPELAQSLTELGLIDEYQIYLNHTIAGSGKRFFAGPTPELRLVGSEQIGGQVVRLRYVPA